MVKLLMIFAVIVPLVNIAQTPPVFIHQNLKGEVILAEIRNFGNHIGDYSLLKEFSACKEVRITNNQNDKEMKECRTSFNPSFTFQDIDFEERDMVPSYKFNRIHQVKRLHKDSLVFEIFGSSDIHDVCAGTTYRSVTETRKYRDSDSLLLEIVVAPHMYGVNKPITKWTYVYENDRLKNVLIQGYDSTKSTFFTRQTLEWVYDHRKNCVAYLAYSGSPNSRIKDSIVSWKNKLHEYAQFNLHEIDLYDLGMERLNFKIDDQYVYEFYHFKNENDRITQFIGYEGEFDYLFESEIKYSGKGNILKYKFNDRDNLITLECKYTYKSGKLSGKSENMKGRIGKPKYSRKMNQKYTYNEAGMLANLKTNRKYFSHFIYD